MIALIFLTLLLLILFFISGIIFDKNPIPYWIGIGVAVSIMLLLVFIGGVK